MTSKAKGTEVPESIQGLQQGRDDFSAFLFVEYNNFFALLCDI